jgi:hypothetical protein
MRGVPVKPTQNLRTRPRTVLNCRMRKNVRGRPGNGMGTEGRGVYRKSKGKAKREEKKGKRGKEKRNQSVRPR